MPGEPERGRDRALVHARPSAPERSGSSSCRAIWPPASRWYWSARRSTPRVARSAGRRRRSRPPPRRAARPSRSAPRPPCPRVTLARKPTGIEASPLRPLAQRAEDRRPCRRAAWCWPSRGSRSSRRPRRRGCRSRCPPRPRRPGVRRWTCGSKKAGKTPACPRPRSTSAPSTSRALPGLGELGDLAVADDDVVGAVDARARVEHGGAPRTTRSPPGPAASAAPVERRADPFAVAHAGCLDRRSGRRAPGRRARAPGRGRRPRAARRGSPSAPPGRSRPAR